MRTTLNIDDDVLQTIRVISENSDKSLGQVVTELLRRSLTTTAAVHYENELPVFEVREKAKPITIEDVKKDEDEG